MKHLTTTLWLVSLLSISSLQAQTFNSKAPSSFVVWTVKGEASFTEKDTKEAKPLKPGMTLKDNSTVVIEKKSAVQLVRNNEVVSIREEGTYSLNGTMVAKITQKLSNANSYFFQRLIAACTFADGKTKVGEEGSGYGGADGKTKVGEEGSGYGGADGKTKVGEEGSGYGGADGKTKVGEEGSGYGGADGKTKVGEEGSGYGKKEAKAKIKEALAPVKADPLYKGSKKGGKLLMKAACMEKVGLKSKAAFFYKKALSKNENDPIANQMYAMFLKQ